VGSQRLTAWAMARPRPDTYCDITVLNKTATSKSSSMNLEVIPELPCYFFRLYKYKPWRWP
jgi:hypothetical protein